MIVAALCLIAALLLGKAGFDEMLELGIRGGLVQPFWAGVVGMTVSVGIAVAGVAVWQQWKHARTLATVAGVLSIAFHVYGALPPHRNVGIIGAVVGVVIGTVLLLSGRRLAGRGSDALPGRTT